MATSVLEKPSAVVELLRLTDLHATPPGFRRAVHGYATSGTWRRVIYRAAAVAQEVAAALPRDALRAVRAPAGPIRMQEGVDPAPDADRIALYVHYSVTGQVSAMVQRQLALLRQLGFAITFISMAGHIIDDDWQAVRDLCALVIHRQNFGRDFGAWHDVAPEVKRRWPCAREMMLANDSVLGPIHPLEPVIRTMRADGDGFFGLTESLQGGAHLQSYLLLARGAGAVGDLIQFLTTLNVSHSKWLLVQMGELRLARWMGRRGHRVAAVFGYDRLIRAAIADPAERQRLAKSHEKLRDLDRLAPRQAEALLHEWPLNPTHHLWHLLATRFGDPFVKTELVLRNPGHLPDVDEWPAVVPSAAPCSLPMLQAHLDTMRSPDTSARSPGLTEPRA